MSLRKLMMLLMLAVTLVSVSFIPQNAAAAGSTAKDTGSIYVYESGAGGMNTKVIFYDDGKEVVAFDTGFTYDLAQEAIDYLKTKTNHPLKYLVITHPNPDKFNGMSVFKQAGAKIIVSAQTAANIPAVDVYKHNLNVNIMHSFTDETYPKVSVKDIDVTFKKKYTLRMANGGTVELTELGEPGLSGNQTVCYIKGQKALVVGDLIHYGAHAWLEGPIIDGKPVYSSDNWIHVLTRIQKMYDADVTVYGGRGKVATLGVVIPEQIRYLKAADQIVKDYLASIGGDKSKVDYAELQKRFEAAFPDYALGYMIAYGSYGLVNSL